MTSRAIISTIYRFTVRNITVNNANTGKRRDVALEQEAHSLFYSCLRIMELGYAYLICYLGLLLTAMNQGWTFQGVTINNCQVR